METHHDTQMRYHENLLILGYNVNDIFSFYHSVSFYILYCDDDEGKCAPGLKQFIPPTCLVLLHKWPFLIRHNSSNEVSLKMKGACLVLTLGWSNREDHLLYQDKVNVYPLLN